MSELQERLASNIVTSENLAEFTAQKLGLVDSKSDDSVAESENASEPDADNNQSGQDGEINDAIATEDQKERKQNPKLERRFSEITKQREAAREEARAERAQRERLEARLRELETKENLQQSKTEPGGLGPEPEPENFSDMYEYAKALAEYTAEKKLAERDIQDRNRKASEAQEIKFKAWVDRVNAVKSEMPDFDDMVQSSDVRVNDYVRDAIMESEHGPNILYYLAENSDHLKKISEMSIVSSVREIGKIEALYEGASKAIEPKVKNFAKSKAPAPISPLRGALSTVDSGLDSDGNFHGTYQQWKAARTAKRIR